MMAEKRIRQRSVRRVETERLLARLEYQRPRLNGFCIDSRAEFGECVREIVNVERELARRGVPFDLVTDGRHLKIDLFAVPIVGPRPSRKEREERAARMQRDMLLEADA